MLNHARRFASKMIIDLIILIIVLSLYFFIATKNSVDELYRDNGNRVKTYLNNSDLPCLEFTKCKVDVGCVDCSGKCIHLDEDTMVYDGSILEKNLDENDGYCMFDLIDDRHNKKCTNKNGGKWLLTKTGTDSFYFKCHCTSPLFDNGVDGDCSLFKGCIGGKLLPGNEFICECPDGMFHKEVNGVPTCQKQNYFKTKNKSDVDLNAKFLNPQYVGLNVPNPCIYDFLNKQYVPHAGEIVLEDEIAFCKVNDPHFTTVVFEDDYLLNNGGKYANGIVKISTSAPEIGFMYETQTKNEKGESTPLIGKRFQSSSIIPKLPYLDPNSANCGGTGQYFYFAAQIKNFSQSFVYVYFAPEPTLRTISDSKSSFISYIPTFLGLLEMTHRYYSGTIPVITPPIACGVCEILGTLPKLFGKYPEFAIDNAIEYVGNQSQTSGDGPVKTYTMPNFCSRGGKLVENIYTKTFTGVYYDDLEMIHNVSPGGYILAALRSSIPNWKDFNASTFRFHTRVPTLAKGSIGAGLVADGDDCEGNANAAQKYARYTCIDKQLTWRENY